MVCFLENGQVHTGTYSQLFQNYAAFARLVEQHQRHQNEQEKEQDNNEIDFSKEIKYVVEEHQTPSREEVSSKIEKDSLGKKLIDKITTVCFTWSSAATISNSRIWLFVLFFCRS